VFGKRLDLDLNINKGAVMKRLTVAGVVAITMAGFLIVSGRSEQPNNVRDFMRAKLSHSQKVLEGLTTEDYNMIAKNSQEMSLLSQATNWQVLQTTEYLDQSKDFRRTADTLTEAAKKKNLDGAALAYVELTMKCVNCHKYVRGVRMARPNQSHVD
jgi:cytochrome c556